MQLQVQQAKPIQVIPPPDSNYLKLVLQENDLNYVSEDDKLYILE